MTWRPMRHPGWVGASGNPDQAVAAVADVRARITMRLRRIERQVLSARARIENGHDYAAVLADVTAARQALQALARNISVAQHRTMGAPGPRQKIPAAQPQSGVHAPGRCFVRPDSN